MKRIAGFFTKIIDYLDRYIWIVGIIIVGLCTLLATTEVVMRYILHTGSRWIADITILMMCYGVFLCIGPIQKLDSHIKLDIVGGLFPKIRGIELSSLLNNLLLLLLPPVIFYCSLKLISTQRLLGQKTLSSDIPEYFFTLSLFVGMVITCFYGLAAVVRDISMLICKEKASNKAI